jgi:ankyrin repeat protein
MAARGGHTQTVETLLESGMDANAENNIRMTPLMLATASGNKDCVKVLLDHGADVELKNKMRETALSIAQARGFTEIKTMLETAKNKKGFFSF